TDLRISVTDRCNFRCVYCRSADPENYWEHDEVLSWEELHRLARVLVGDLAPEFIVEAHRAKNKNPIRAWNRARRKS
ncbi:hypothetical protein RMT89_45805, partial [Streptomyces sp. P17]|nr:hypothetical protein [Streptomyces sp. P17]